MSVHEDGSDVIDQGPAAGTIDRREAIRRVSLLLGGVTLVGGSSLLAACQRERAAGRRDSAGGAVGEFSTDDIALLDEVAETILPETKTPGAKAAKTGAFMALMVTDSYDARDQKIFRDGMRTLDEASRKANNASFMAATPAQRLSLLETLDREQKTHMDAIDAARKRAKGEKERGSAAGKPPAAKAGEAYLPDQRKEAATGADIGAAAAITADTPPHYFRMMKELALLGYFTSEIGCTQALRYQETPGRYDPCVPYTPGEKAWAPHA
jgi:hypothetical protein